MTWKIFYRKDISVSHRNKWCTLSDVRLSTTVMYIKCQTCGILEAL